MKADILRRIRDVIQTLQSEASTGALDELNRLCNDLSVMIISSSETEKGVVRSELIRLARDEATEEKIPDFHIATMAFYALTRVITFC